MSLTHVPASVEKSLPVKESDDSRVLLTIELQNAMVALEAKQPDMSVGKLFFCIFCPSVLNLLWSAKSARELLWQAILDMVKNLSEIILSSLPNFWKIAKSFMDGKFKRVSIDSLICFTNKT